MNEGVGEERSEIASPALHRVLRKREHTGILRSRVFAACRRAMQTVSALLAVGPLEKDIEQEVTAKNAKRQKYGDGH